MPPKIKITKQNIVDAALALVREGGEGALNARAIAARLGCSTQPIFSNYVSMEELKADVLRAAGALYQQYLDEDMAKSDVPPYKSSGLAYIRFARQERELFRLLFMRDRSGETVAEDRESIAGLLKLIQANTGLDADSAYLVHLEMWIFVHGIATMAATAYLDWDEAHINRMVSDAYQGIRLRWLQREEPGKT